MVEMGKPPLDFPIYWVVFLCMYPLLELRRFWDSRAAKPPIHCSLVKFPFTIILPWQVQTGRTRVALAIVSGQRGQAFHPIQEPKTNPCRQMHYQTRVPASLIKIWLPTCH